MHQCTHNLHHVLEAIILSRERSVSRCCAEMLLVSMVTLEQSIKEMRMETVWQVLGERKGGKNSNTSISWERWFVYLPGNFCINSLHRWAKMWFLSCVQVKLLTHHCPKPPTTCLQHIATLWNFPWLHIWLRTGDIGDRQLSVAY